MISLLNLSIGHNACLWIKSQDATVNCFREYEYLVGTDLAASCVAIELVIETLYAVSICKSDHFVGGGTVLCSHK